MLIQQTRNLALFLLLLFFALSCGSKPEAQITMQGILTFVKGDAFVNGKPAKSGDIVQQSDILTTKDNGMIIIQIRDMAMITLRNNTQLKLEKIIGSATGERSVDLFLQSGTVFNKIARKDNTVQKFQVHTPVAVAGVRGTSFAMTASDEQIHVRLLEGNVSVSRVAAAKIEKTDKPDANAGKSPKVAETMELKAGQKVEITTSKVEKPIAFGGKEKDQLEKLNAIAFVDTKVLDEIAAKKKSGQSIESLRKQDALKGDTLAPLHIPTESREMLDQKMEFDVQPGSESSIDPQTKKLTLEDLRQKYGKLSKIETKDGRVYIGAFKQVGGQIQVETVNGRVAMPVANLKKVARF